MGDQILIADKFLMAEESLAGSVKVEPIAYEGVRSEFIRHYFGRFPGKKLCLTGLEANLNYTQRVVRPYEVLLQLVEQFPLGFKHESLSIHFSQLMVIEIVGTRPGFVDTEALGLSLRKVLTQDIWKLIVLDQVQLKTALVYEKKQKDLVHENRNQFGPQRSF